MQEKLSTDNRNEVLDCKKLIGRVIDLREKSEYYEINNHQIIPLVSPFDELTVAVQEQIRKERYTLRVALYDFSKRKFVGVPMKFRWYDWRLSDFLELDISNLSVTVDADGLVNLEWGWTTCDLRFNFGADRDSKVSKITHGVGVLSTSGGCYPLFGTDTPFEGLGKADWDKELLMCFCCGAPLDLVRAPIPAEDL